MRMADRLIFVRTKNLRIYGRKEREREEKIFDKKKRNKNVALSQYLIVHPSRTFMNFNK